MALNLPKVISKMFPEMVPEPDSLPLCESYSEPFQDWLLAWGPLGHLKVLWSKCLYGVCMYGVCMVSQNLYPGKI